jgi:hypothetical protein
MQWCHGQETLKEFLDLANNFYPSINFTSEVSNDKHVFFDTVSTLEDNKIAVDLYSKPTDTHQYLLPTSCHPKHCSRNIYLDKKCGFTSILHQIFRILTTCTMFKPNYFVLVILYIIIYKSYTCKQDTSSNKTIQFKILHFCVSLGFFYNQILLTYSFLILLQGLTVDTVWQGQLACVENYFKQLPPQGLTNEEWSFFNESRLVICC